MRPPSFKVLTWHSCNISDNSYAGNDQVAFAEDLQLLHREGARIWPLRRALDALDQGNLPPGVVALTADDGAKLDFLPFEHPTCGLQPGLFPILHQFTQSLPGDSPHQPHLSCFVIASPEARSELDRKAFLGLDLWHDQWWPQAIASGMVALESHSWDHNHPTLERTCQRDNQRGDFRLIETEAECRAEIDQASDYIERRSGRRPQFLAYPWGQSSDFLRRDYLPRVGPGIGLQAAFGVEPAPVAAGMDRWDLPRYVCGQDWKSPDELRILLRD